MTNKADCLKSAREQIAAIELLLYNDSILDDVEVEKLKTKLKALRTIEFGYVVLIENEG